MGKKSFRFTDHALRGDYEQALVLLEQDMVLARGQDRPYLLYQKARLLAKSGAYNEAYPVYRQLVEDRNASRAVRAGSYRNLATLAAMKHDLAYARNVAVEFHYFCEEIGLGSEAWSRLLCDESALTGEVDTLLQWHAQLHASHKIGFQTLLAIICSLNNHTDQLILFYFNSEKADLGINFLSTVCEVFVEIGDINQVKNILEMLESRKLSDQENMIRDYVELNYLNLTGGDFQRKLKLARRIFSKLKDVTIFHHSALVDVCAAVIRQSDTRDRVLVPSRHGIIGITPAISALRERIERFARSGSPVLVQGESGTGKELVAQALHDASERAAAPFIPVNCAAIPESVFESQLFGHVAGAFTGAAKDQPGLIELAGTGTLFLDEVGELPAAVQAKLLRFLENGEYRRLGSERILRSQARIVAATHRNLALDESFRTDLFHRLRRLEIQVPPLREHAADVRYLARHRIRQLNLQEGSGWKQLDEDAESLLENLDYPGNVRELFNLVDHAWHEAVQPVGTAELWKAMRRLAADRERAAAQGRNLPLKPGALKLDTGRQANGPLKLLQEEVAVHAVRQTVAHFHGDMAKAAAWLDISKRSVYRYLERGRDTLQPAGAETTA
jgi:DNA-binding NtrC family response regulator